MKSTILEENKYLNTAHRLYQEWVQRDGVIHFSLLLITKNQSWLHLFWYNKEKRKKKAVNHIIQVHFLHAVCFSPFSTFDDAEQQL